MSIYCSRVTAGRDYFEQKNHGRVVAYPENNLARITPDWPEGSIDTAHVPHWCVPSHEAHDLSHECPVSEWLRLSVSVGGAYVDVLLDEEAVRVLRKDFGRWLKLGKAIAGEACANEAEECPVDRAEET